MLKGKNGDNGFFIFVAYTYKEKRAKRKILVKKLLQRLKVKNTQSELIHIQGSTQKGISLTGSSLVVYSSVRNNTERSVVYELDSKTNQVSASVEMDFPACEKVVHYRDMSLYFCRDSNIYIFYKGKETNFYFIKGFYCHRGVRSDSPRDIHLEGSLLYYPCIVPRPFIKHSISLVRLDLRDIYTKLDEAMEAEVVLNMEKYISKEITNFLRYIMTPKWIFLLWRCGVTERYDKKTMELSLKRNPNPRPADLWRCSNGASISHGKNLVVVGFSPDGLKIVLQLLGNDFFEKSILKIQNFELSQNEEIYGVYSCDYKFHDIVSIVFPSKYIVFVARYKNRFIHLKNFDIQGNQNSSEILLCKTDRSNEEMIFYTFEPSYHIFTFKLNHG